MSDFVPCVPQIYQDAQTGRWWRYCLVCDNGSNKYGKHRRGHRTEADAQMSFRDHAKATERNHHAWQRYAAWRLAVVMAPDWKTFNELWHARHPEIALNPEPPQGEESLRVMAVVQQLMRTEIDAVHTHPNGGWCMRCR